MKNEPDDGVKASKSGTEQVNATSESIKDLSPVYDVLNHIKVLYIGDGKILVESSLVRAIYVGMGVYTFIFIALANFFRSDPTNIDAVTKSDNYELWIAVVAGFMLSVLLSFVVSKSFSKGGPFRLYFAGFLVCSLISFLASR